MALSIYSYRRMVQGCTFLIEAVESTGDWRLVYCVGAGTYFLQRCAKAEACALLFKQHDPENPDWKTLRERLPNLVLPPDIHDLKKWSVNLS